MKTSSQLIAIAATALLSFGAQAAMPVNAADLPRISNGGTGFIGVTESAGMAQDSRSAYVRPAAGGNTWVPAQAGEASTMVNGVPNQQQAAAGNGADLRTMGAAPANSYSTGAAAMNPSWGTPK
jgi:hypothetical protein